MSGNMMSNAKVAAKFLMATAAMGAIPAFAYTMLACQADENYAVYKALEQNVKNHYPTDVVTVPSAYMHSKFYPGQTYAAMLYDKINTSPQTSAARDFNIEPFRLNAKSLDSLMAVYPAPEPTFIQKNGAALRRAIDF